MTPFYEHLYYSFDYFTTLVEFWFSSQAFFMKEITEKSIVSVIFGNAHESAVVNKILKDIFCGKS